MPSRMEDGNQMLTHWTRKIIVEEGHTLAQLMHVLQLIVRHHTVSLRDLFSVVSSALKTVGVASLPSILSTSYKMIIFDGVLDKFSLF